MPRHMFLQESAPQGPQHWKEAAEQFYLTLRNVIWLLNQPNWRSCGAGFFFSGGVGRREVFKDRAQVRQFFPLCPGKPGCVGLSVISWE